MQRRDFIAAATAAAALMQSKSIHAAQAPGSGQQMSPTHAGSREAASNIPRVTHPGTMKGEMLYRQLGATGEQVSVIGLGGSHLGKANVQEDEALRLIH